MPDILSAAWSQLWQVTLLIPFALLAVRVGCRQRMHLAYGLLMIVVLKCLTPPLWSSDLGLFSWAGRSLAAQSLLRVEWTLDGNPDAAADAPASPVTIAATPETVLATVPPTDAVPITPVPEPVVPDTVVQTASPAVAAAAVAASPEPRPAVPPARPDLGTLVLIALASVWLTGAAGFGLFLTIQQARFRVMHRRAVVDPPPHVALMFDDLCDELAFRRRPQLLVSSLPTVPVAFGLFQPMVVLPVHLAGELTNDELRYVLAHELNHHRRGDILAGFVQMVVQVAWWFHPLVWWLNCEVRRHREQCCDEEVVARIECRPAQYARCLVKVIDLHQHLKPMPSLAGLSPFEVTARRLESLMKHTRPFEARSPHWCWAALLVMAALILPGAPRAAGTAGEYVSKSDRYGVQSPATPEIPPPDLESLREEAGGRRPDDALVTVAAPRYGWRIHEEYAYQVRVEIDRHDETETLMGTPVFRVVSSDDVSAALTLSSPSLMSSIIPKPQIRDPLSFPRFPRPPRIRHPRFPTLGPAEVRLDRTGRIVRDEIDEPLPYLLGSLPELIFDRLPEQWAQPYEQHRTTSVVIEPDEDELMTFSPFRRGRPTERLEAEEFVRVAAETQSGESAVLRKEHRLTTLETVDGEPRLETRGVATVTFDRIRGLPTSIQYEGTYTERSPYSTVKSPVVVSIRLLSDDERKELRARAEAAAAKARLKADGPPDYAGPRPVPSSGRPLTDETELTAGQLIQVEWNGQWYPADVVRLEESGQVAVHYRGWGASFDETVARSRIQLPHEQP